MMVGKATFYCTVCVPPVALIKHPTQYVYSCSKCKNNFVVSDGELKRLG